MATRYFFVCRYCGAYYALNYPLVQYNEITLKEFTKEHSNCKGFGTYVRPPHFGYHWYVELTTWDEEFVLLDHDEKRIILREMPAACLPEKCQKWLEEAERRRYEEMQQAQDYVLSKDEKDDYDDELIKNKKYPTSSHRNNM